MWIAVEGTLVYGVPNRAMAQTVTASASASASDAVTRRWAGSYVYEDALGEIPTGSGTHAFITYKLHVPKSASQPVTLNADGFQTEDRIHCAVSGNEDRIEVRFVSFADGTVANQFGVAVYQPNDVLFTLERVRTNGAQALVTEWKAQAFGRSLCAGPLPAASRTTTNARSKGRVTIPSLTASVGKSGTNQLQDVRLVQQLLNRFQSPAMPLLKVDGRANPTMLAAIDSLQKQKAIKPVEATVTSTGAVSKALCGGDTSKTTLAWGAKVEASFKLKLLQWPTSSKHRRTS